MEHTLLVKNTALNSCLPQNFQIEINQDLCDDVQIFSQFELIWLFRRLRQFNG